MNMYNGKYSGKKRRLLKTRQFVILTSLALLLVGLVGGSLAYLFMSTQSVNNTFTEAHVSTEVTESFSNGVKSNVKIKNTGNISAYIRAAVVINWQNADGEIYGEAPVEGEDYTISYNTTAWTDNRNVDGFFYYNSVVAPNDSTGDLIVTCTPTPEGKTRTDDEGNTYYFTVTILSSGIQAKGMGAANAQAAWTAAASN